MDPQFFPLNTSNDIQKELQIPDNNKTIHLTSTNKNKLVFLKPNNDNVNNKMYCVLRPEDLQLKLPSPIKVAKPGRPKRVHNEKEILDITENNIITEEVPRKVFRTRSGRVTKPPRYINQELPNKIEHLLETTHTHLNEKQNVDNSQTTSEVIDNKLPNSISQNVSNFVEPKRNISSQYRCGTCKKAYLGRAKMLKHLQLNSDHIAPKFFKNNKNNHPDLWTDLINKTKTVQQDEQVSYIYKEFVTFLQKAREVIPKLLKPESDPKNNFITVDQVFSNALGIPEGCYSFIKQNVADILNVETDNKNNGIKQNKNLKSEGSSHNVTNNTNGYIHSQDRENNEKEFVQQITNPDTENCVQIQNNDQNSLLNLLDTGQVTFDNANSEEVMNVDQLIHERLKSLTGGEIETNSASQNLHLDLSLDMFSYHTNNI